MKPTRIRSTPTRTLLIGSSISNGYLWLMIGLHLNGIYNGLIGFVNEMLTIPALVGIIMFFVLLLVRMLRGQITGRERIWAMVLMCSTVLYFLLIRTLD